MSKLLVLLLTLALLGGVVYADQVSESPFGVAYGEGARNLDHFMDYIHDLGVSRTKVSFYWNDLEPKPGVYDFSALDQYLSQLGPDDCGLLNIFTDGWCTQQQGVCKGSPLVDCPYNAADCGASCADRYREFILAVAEHVKELANGGIKYWQRDTEPASPFPHYPADAPEEYVELQKIFYEAVKSVFPDAIVIGGNHNGAITKSGEPTNAEFFDYFLKNARDYFDILDVRLYNDIYTISSRVEWFRDRMHMYGYDKPIVCTEQGGPDPRTVYDDRGRSLFFSLLRNAEKDRSTTDSRSKLTHFLRYVRSHRDDIDPKLWPFYFQGDPEQAEIYTRMQAADIVERNVVTIASGVEGIWWWNLRSPGADPIFGQMRLMNDRYEELPGYDIYQRMTRTLGAVTGIVRIQTDDPSVYLYRVDRSDDESSVYVAWRREGNTDPYDALLAPAVEVDLPITLSQPQVFDAQGNPVDHTGALRLKLGGMPIYIVQSETEAEAYTRASAPQIGLNFIRVYWDDTHDCFQPDVIFQDFADLGVQAYRQFIKADLYWNIVEPRDDEWNFTAADAVITDPDFVPIVTLFSNQFASPTPPWCDDPSEFQKTLGPEAVDYLTHVVDRYAPYVKYWEIGNEMEHWRAADPGSTRRRGLPKCHPSDGFSPQEQGAFFAQVAAVIRQHDPDAIIVMPGMGGLNDYVFDTWLSGVIEGGGSDWFDIVNYHYYGPWEPYTILREKLDAFLKEHGLDDKPVWMTETGSTSSPTLTIRTDYPNSPETQAADVFRRIIQAWGAGDDLVLWHTYIGSADTPTNTWREYGLREADGTAKPALYSFRLLANELVPFESVTPLQADLRGANIYRIVTESGDTKYVVWGSGEFTVPADVSRMTSAVPDADGNFAWQEITFGQIIPLSSIPLLLK